MDFPSNGKDVNESSDFTPLWHDRPEQTQFTGIEFLKALVVCLIILCAVIGNLLVIFSVYRHHQLRRVTYYIIVSLAFADLLVALLGMTFSASFMIAKKWLFNRTVCFFWHSCDVFFSTASILNLCCISVDRYFAVFKPFEYHKIMTGRVVAIMLTCVWILSGCISFLPIFLEWHIDQQVHYENPNDCIFVVNKVYVIVSSCVSFWIPGIVIVLSYFLIYVKAVEQERLLRKHKVVPSLMRRNFDENGDSEIPYVQIPTFHTAHFDDETGAGGETKRPNMTVKNVRKMKQEFRVVKTLAIVVGAFIFCWLPFSLLYLTLTLCGDSCYCPIIVFEIAMWVAYFNSVLNPIIYGFCNKNFKEAFKDIIQTFVCCCTKISCLANENGDVTGVSSDRSTENVNLEEVKNTAE